MHNIGASFCIAADLLLKKDLSVWHHSLSASQRNSQALGAENSVV